MNRSQANRWTAAALLVAAVLVLPALSQAATEPVGAVLSTVLGGVQYKAKGALVWQAASSQQPLNSGDELKTGADGKALVVFLDGTKVMLSPGSDFALQSNSPKKIDIKMAVGLLEAWVKKVKGRRFAIKTPSSVAAIRGTELRCEVDTSGATSWDLFNGGLQISDSQGNEQQMDSGQRLVADPTQGVAQAKIEAIPPSVQPSPEPVGDKAAAEAKAAEAKAKAEDAVLKAKAAEEKALLAKKEAAAAKDAAKAVEKEAKQAEKEALALKAKAEKDATDQSKAEAAKAEQAAQALKKAAEAAAEKTDAALKTAELAKNDVAAAKTEVKVAEAQAVVAEQIAQIEAVAAIVTAPPPPAPGTPPPPTGTQPPPPGTVPPTGALPPPPPGGEPPPPDVIVLPPPDTTPLPPPPNPTQETCTAVSPSAPGCP